MSRRVFYSLWTPPGATDTLHREQLLVSVQSLRNFNSEVPVELYLYGEGDERSESLMLDAGVEIIRMGDYGSRLSRRRPGLADVLALYPVLHRWISFAEAARHGDHQLLYVDCDTFFFDDVDRLFETYTDAGWCAREEPYCSRSTQGYNPSYLDEDQLAALAQAYGVRYIPPFNLGVVLMNESVSTPFLEQFDFYLDTVWELLAAASRSPHRHRLEPAMLTAIMEAIRCGEPTRDVTYPSQNVWIVEEIASWLTLGLLPDVRVTTFSPDDVLQSPEFIGRELEPTPWILAHYYSTYTPQFFRWISGVVSQDQP